MVDSKTNGLNITNIHLTDLVFLFVIYALVVILALGSFAIELFWPKIQKMF